MCTHIPLPLFLWRTLTSIQAGITYLVICLNISTVFERRSLREISRFSNHAKYLEKMKCLVEKHKLQLSFMFESTEE